jgi:hypothetical protein
MVVTSNYLAWLAPVVCLAFSPAGPAGHAAQKPNRTVRADLYVSPKGDDRNPGTLAKPVKTLGRARDAVRKLQRNRAKKSPVVVMLRGGTYRLAQPVVFSDQDSGTKEAPITYMAYPGERPIMSGGRLITGWKVYKDRILSAGGVLKHEDKPFHLGQLFWNGKRQMRARFPNFDPKNPWYGGWAFIESTVPADGKAPLSFRWEPGVFPRRWAKAEQGEIFIIPGLAWNSHLLPIRAVHRDKRMITVGRKLSLDWDKLTPGNRFYVENLLEELDQPGEWCFDSDTNTLYFWPPTGALDKGEVTAPMLDRLIELRATNGKPVRYLRFFGLTFTQSLTGFPNTMPQRPDYVDCNRPISGGYAFLMENAEHCCVENCRFDQVGGDAIRLHNYNAYNRIVGNEIVGAGAQGICLAHLDFWPYDFPPIWRGQTERLRSMASRLPWAIGNLISRNHIHHCGSIDNFGAGIHLHGLNCRDNVISHNLIHDMPHHAIYLSMGFGRNRIEYNDVRTLCLAMADAGGIYSNRWCILEEDPVLKKNSVIRFNRIRDVHGVHPQGKKVAHPAAVPSQDRIQVPYFTWGIYFDNSPRRATVYGNITAGNVLGGVFLGGGYAEPGECVVENNILIESSAHQLDLQMNEHAAGNRFVRNIVYFRNPRAALLRAGPPKGIRECDYNLYFHAGGAKLKVLGVPDQSLSRWRKMGFDGHSLLADPLFVDAAKGDYRLRPDSPAFKLGFKPIPVERIGPWAKGQDPESGGEPRKTRGSRKNNRNR